MTTVYTNALLGGGSSAAPYYNYASGQTQVLSSTYTYTSIIQSFDSANNIATLVTPINVSLGYNSVVGPVTSQYSISGTSLNVSQAIQNGTAATLSTDEAGNFIGIFNVPSNTFQTGSRVFRVDNRTVTTDPTSATTYAEATFTASGLATTSQQLEFAPSVDSSASTFTSVSQTPSVSTIVSYSPYDPVAQTFIIDKTNYPNGIFIQSLKLFFATKPAGIVPVTVSIIPTLNGYPNGQALDYSTVTLTSDQVLTSSTPHYLDPTTYTEFMFQAPVYIQPGVLYAIKITANSPDYTLYYAQQNQLAVPSSAKNLPTDPNPTNPTKIGTAPYVGALFESQNSITWTADQTKDLMFVIDRCVFDTTQTPQIQFSVLKGLPFRKLGNHDMLYSMSNILPTAPTDNWLNLPNLYGNYVNYNVPTDAINLTTTDFVPSSTAINYNYYSTLSNGNVPVGPYAVTPGKYGSPTADNIALSDGQGERVLLTNTSSSFYMTATMTSSDSNVSPILSDDGITLYNIQYMINNMGLSNNVISVANTGSGYNASTISVSVSNPDVGSNIAVLAANVVSGNLVSINVLYAGSGYLTSPTITISDPTTRSGNANASIVVYGETSQHGGNSLAKYFTKKVVMTPGNDSGDLRVFYTAYKPLGTNVYVYYKILSSQDTQNFDDGSWQLMTQVSNQNVYSSSTSDFIEFECAPGVFLSGLANNNISYVSVNGQTYTNFIQFAIKLVMSTNDNTLVPIVGDIRAIALPPGTGI